MGPPVRETISQICRRYPKFAPQAHYFVLDALHRRLHSLDSPRHITGEELAQSARTLYARRAAELQEKGVTLLDATRCWIDRSRSR